MNSYIGTKMVRAEPMTRQDYNDYRGWKLPEDENGDDEGFLVEYTDGGRANDSRHAGYISWSPKDVFGKAYRPLNGLTFGIAIEALKQGEVAARAGWNGKDMYIALVKSSEWQIDTSDRLLRDFIVMKTVDGELVPWMASQTDMLAEDWILL